MEDSGDMGGMMGDGKFLLDDAANHGTVPNTGGEPVSYWATVQDICQYPPLALGKLGRATRSFSFLKSVQSAFLPIPQPNRNFRPMDFQCIGDLGGGFTFHVGDDGL
jgi:hypothetical protein